MAIARRFLQPRPGAPPLRITHYVLRISSHLLLSPGEEYREVACQAACGTVFFAEELTGEAVKVHACTGGVDGGEALGQEANYRARENVAGARRGEGGVGEGAGVDFAGRFSYQGGRALEDHYLLPIGGGVPGYGDAVALDLLNS